MRRLRTTYLDDWEDMEAEDEPRLRMLGRSFNPLAVLGCLALAVMCFVGLLFLAQMDWFPDSAALHWAMAGLSIVVMLVSIVVSAICIRAIAKSIRHSRIRLARLDGATDEEAQHESDRYINRKVYLRLAIYAAICLALWLILGSPFIFEWAGVAPYLCGIAVFMVCSILYSTGQFTRVWNRLRGNAGGR